SGVLDGQPYGFESRFKKGQGTNPEELIGAAHAGCFTMALAHELGEAGYTPQALDTSAEVVLEQKESGFTITKVNLSLKANIPGIEQDEFDRLADSAKENCPVSKLLDASIELEKFLTTE